jgi:hypothetical protein
LISIIQTALIYDTRDFEPDPTSGYYFEIANIPVYIGSQFEFKLFLQGKGFEVAFGKRTVVASRKVIFGPNAPFLNFKNGVQMAVLTLWEKTLRG